MEKPVQIDAGFIGQNTSYTELILFLKEAFSTNMTIVPSRHHHYFPNPKVGEESTLLIMPAWKPSEDAGVKVVTVNPKNDIFDLPSVQGSYLYLDATRGVLKAIVEAKELTAKRTAATSALASSFLSKKNASSLLMIGTGALSVNLILAHAAVRPIKQVYVWGRNFDKAMLISKRLKDRGFKVEAVLNLSSVISDVDIVSCATLSKTPLVLGKYLRAGQHIDLVGAYRPDMRETDNETMRKASIFLDNLETGMVESGDIFIPLKEEAITKIDIKADLFELCSGQKSGRKNDDEITVFKSVGHALEDLTAARYYYNKYTDETNLR